MTTKLSTGLVEYIAGTGSLRDAFNGDCRLSIYGGTEVAGADLSAAGATLLCEVKAGGSPLEFESAVANGVVTKDSLQVWSGINAATGTATWWRLEQIADDRGASTSYLRVQGSVGTVVGEIIMTNPSLVTGAVKAIENFRMAVPAA